MNSVVISGAGPVGLTLALLLAKRGVRCTLVEQRETPTSFPAAHVLGVRTLEVFRELGLDREIHAAAAPEEDLAHIVFCTSLTGRELGRIDLGRVARQLPWSTWSPTMMAHLPQHQLERILWRAIEREQNIHFVRGQRVERFEQGSRGVIVHTSEGVSLEGDFLVGTDGANSIVRKHLGIAMDGPILQRVVGIHFDLDLSRHLEGRRGPLYWILGERTQGTLIGYTLPNEWVYMVPLLPGQLASDFSHDVCQKHLSDAVGAPVEPRILHVSPWTMTAQVARHYRKGRVFLAGDAAHRFPPTGGLGLNTGIKDAHNLAWKIAMVLAGDAPAALLDTYEAEGRPVAIKNSQASVANLKNLFGVVAGLPALETMIRLRKLAEGPLFTALPARARRAVVRRMVVTASERVAALDRDDRRGAELRARAQATIPRLLGHFLSPNLDLGTVFEADAAKERTASDDKGPAHTSPEPYRPTTRPGARLPHAWVTEGGVVRSTLDDCSSTFTLLVGRDRGGWLEAHRTFVGETQTDALRVVAIAREGADVIDADGSWEKVREVSDDGAILVRPDGHVAMRWSHLPESPAVALRSAWAHALGNSTTLVARKETLVAPISPSTRPPLQIAHLVFKTARVDAMCRWYSQVLGAQVVFRDERLAFLTFDQEHHRVALVRVPLPVAWLGRLFSRFGRKLHGFDHVAFSFASFEALLEHYATLRDAGIHPVWCINHGPTTSFYYEDPDGNRAELQVDNMHSTDALLEFVATTFRENPIGVNFDPELLLAKMRAGVPESELARQGSGVPEGERPVAGFSALTWRTL